MVRSFTWLMFAHHNHASAFCLALSAQLELVLPDRSCRLEHNTAAMRFCMEGPLWGLERPRRRDSITKPSQLNGRPGKQLEKKSTITLSHMSPDERLLLLLMIPEAFPKRCKSRHFVISSGTDITIDIKAGEPSLIGRHGQFHGLLISSAGAHTEMLGKQHPYRALAHVHM
ncbi:uncharacterized [Tachysurus ichikawai]